MSILASRFRDMVSGLKDKRESSEASFRVAYPTGFLSFDFMNGSVIKVENEEKGMDFKYNSIGIPDGSLVSVVGRSGCGKTTFVMQAAGNIVRDFENGVIFHEDIEGGISEMRKQQLLNFGDKFHEKYICRDSGITSNNFYSRIKKIHDMKLEAYDDYSYDTGLYDSDGNKIFKLEPTVVILDSWALLMSDKLTEEEEISGQMSVTSNTKQNTAVIKKTTVMLKAANIILFVINHILPEVSIMPKKSQNAWLKTGERFPGGDTVVYLSNNILRFDDGVKLKEDKGFCISGIEVEVQFIKSRSNTSGKTVTLVFDYANGFDPELSLYMLLKQHNKIKGASTSFYIEGLDTVKFSQRKFKEKLAENPELLEHFVVSAMDILENEIINTAAIEAMETEKEPPNTANLILERMKQNTLSATAKN